MNQYLLRFKNRIRNRWHVYYVDSLKDAEEILENFGNMVGEERGIYELMETPSIYYNHEGQIGMKNLFHTINDYEKMWKENKN